MPNVITAKIDVTLIDKARLFPGKKKNKKDKLPQYLDIVLMPTKQSNFGDYRDKQTHMVVQSVSAEEREQGIKGEILGNAIEIVKRGPGPSAPVTPPPAPESAEGDGAAESDSIPF